MLKYKELIESLTVEQKLSLAASLRSLSAPWAEQAGIPSVRISDAAKVNADNGAPVPSFAALSNSWNRQLMGDAARELALLAQKDAVDLMMLPRMGVRCTPYCEGISEDPYLAGVYADAVITGATDAGVMPCMTGCALNDGDIAAMDQEFDPRALYEYWLPPVRAVRRTNDKAVAFSYTGKVGSYAEANISLVNSFLREQSGEDGFVLCDEIETGRDAECLAAGNLLLDGDASVLKSAMERAQKHKAESNGNAGDVHFWNTAGLERAADRVIGLAAACKSMGTAHSEPADNGEFWLQAAQESVVLLKNDGILPLKSGWSVALIGHPSGMSASKLEGSLQAHGVFRSVGSALGYWLEAERSDEEIPNAYALAKKADAVLLFLRGNAPAEGGGVRAKLPANRLALLDALTRVNPNVIVVLSAEEPLDLSFEKDVRAMLIAETNCARGDEALLNILSGKTSPSGRLASTCYSDTDARFAAMTEAKNAGKNKIGVFHGYRRYDTAGEPVQYPFGFGLSYTSFAYSNLAVENGNVSLTLRNKGKIDGHEVVQLYVGKSDSSVVRPRKELKAFEKVFLRAGKSVRLSFPIDPEALAVYHNGAYVVEDGLYSIYIGASATDVRLETQMRLKGETVEGDGKDVSEYIRSISNVLAGNYTLEPVNRTLRKNIRMLKWAKDLLFFAVLGEILSTIMGFGGWIENVFLDYLLAALFIFVFPATFVTALSMLIVGLKRRKRSAKSMTLSNGCVSVQKEIVSERSYERLFEETFGKGEEPEPSNDAIDKRVETSQYCDDARRLSDVCGQFAAFMEERGISVGIRSARKILSAFCASRLIVFHSAAAPLPPKFYEALTEYFGGDLNLYEFTPREGLSDETAQDGALHADGASARENATKAFRQARENGAVIHLAAWRGASAEGVVTAIESYRDYIEQPERAARTETREREGDSDTGFSPNVWFVFGLDNLTERGSEQLWETACFVDFAFEETAEKEEKTAPAGINNRQFAALARACRSEYCLDEERCWKKLDRLEKYVGTHRAYRIDQKTGLRLEKFTAAYLACGGEEAEALDCAIAAILLPPMLTASGGKALARDLALETKNIFGAESASEIQNAVTAFSAVTSL